jgi:hypothetical protein
LFFWEKQNFFANKVNSYQAKEKCLFFPWTRHWSCLILRLSSRKRINDLYICKFCAMVVNIVNMYDKPRANSPHGHKISPLLTSRTTDNFFRLPQSKPADKIFLSLRWTTHKKCDVWLHDSLLPGRLFLHVNGAMKKTKQQGCGRTVQVPSEYQRLCKTPAVLCSRVKRKIRSVVQVELHLPKSGHNGYPRSQSWDVHFWFPAALRFSSLNRSNMVWSTKNAQEFFFLK